MSLLTGILVFIATVLAMEVFAYAMHRWVMHGRLGWFLHESHHCPRHGWFELNDLYGVIFALPSIALIYMGTLGGWGAWAAWVGAGIAGYGAIYFGFHDLVVHQRTRLRVVPRSRYFRRIVQAHKLHHAVTSREGSVSFGFIWAPPIEALKAELQRQRSGRIRAPGVQRADGSINLPD